MIIKSLKINPNLVFIELSPNLALKLLCMGFNVSRDNFIAIRKNRFAADFLEPMAANGIPVDQVIEKSFLELTHKYSVDSSELAAWTLLHGKISSETVKLSCSKYFMTVFQRSINVYPEIRESVLKLVKSFRSLAKKQGDTDFYQSLNSKLSDSFA